MINVLYIPLDDRDCNYEFPWRLSLMTEDMRIVRPDYSMIGALKQPADVDRLWQWMFEKAPECSYAIVSVDTLLYGNLIGSRIHELSEETCMQRLANFRKLREINPSLRIHPLNMIARAAAYNDDHEDPDYWQYYGYDIWHYGYLSDKAARGCGETGEAEEIEAIKNRVPAEIFADFNRRREVDRAVNLACIDMTKEGIFEKMTIPIDDCQPFGYAAMDQNVIFEKIRRERLADRVYVYPGADEVASVLFSRVFCLEKHYRPAVYVRYSSAGGPRTIQNYEDRPLAETIRWHVTSAGAVITETPCDCDLMLAVNCSGTRQLESSNWEKKDFAFRTNTNSEEFLTYIDYFCDKYGRSVGLADTTTSNGADTDFMDNAVNHGTLEKVQSYGGWNTSSNTIGVVLAAAVIAAYYDCFAQSPGQKEAAETFKVRAAIADWLYQGLLLNRFYTELRDNGNPRNINPYLLRENGPWVREKIEAGLRELIEDRFGSTYRGRRIVLDRIRFNWDGMFYYAVDCHLD